MELLGEEGLIVERAADGEACCTMLAQAPEDYYALVLMDIQMPVLNGYEAATKIRGMKDAKKAGIPIIAMTANAFEEDRALATEAGMNGYLTKPIDVEKMMKTIASFL